MTTVFQDVNGYAAKDDPMDGGNRKTCLGFPYTKSETGLSFKGGSCPAESRSKRKSGQSFTL